MTQKTRTTILIRKELIKTAKHKALEHDMSLSEIMEDALVLWLKDISRSAIQTPFQKKSDIINSLAGRASVGITAAPGDIKNAIEKRYAREMLS